MGDQGRYARARTERRNAESGYEHLRGGERRHGDQSYGKSRFARRSECKRLYDRVLLAEERSDRFFARHGQPYQPQRGRAQRNVFVRVHGHKQFYAARYGKGRLPAVPENRDHGKIDFYEQVRIDFARIRGSVAQKRYVRSCDGGREYPRFGYGGLAVGKLSDPERHEQNEGDLYTRRFDDLQAHDAGSGVRGNAAHAHVCDSRYPRFRSCRGDRIRSALFGAGNCRDV